MSYYDGTGVATMAAGTTVAQITVPSAIHIKPTAPDNTVTIPAVLRTSGGRPLPGTPTSWTSSNTGVVTVNSAGVATYVADGNATITAHYATGSVDSAAVLVTCSPAQGGDEEPAGFQVLNYQFFDVALPAGWQNGGVLDTGGGGYSIVNDPTSPGSPPLSVGAPNVGQIRMKAYVWQGTAGSGSDATHLVLDGTASSANGSYVGSPVSVWSPGGTNHRRMIINAYVGATRTATCEREYTDTPPHDTFSPVPVAGDTVYIHAMQPGSGAGRLDVASGTSVPLTYAPTQLYWSGWFKCNANYNACYNDDLATGAGVNKWVEGNAHDNYYGNRSPYIHCPEWLNTDVSSRFGTMQPSAVVISGRYCLGASPGDGAINAALPMNFDLTQNENLSVTLPRNQWVFAQALIRFSSIGNADGSYQFWLTVGGVKKRLINYPAIQFENRLGFLSRFVEFNWQSVYGGGGAPIQEDNYTWMDDFYISGAYRTPDEEPTHWQITSIIGGTTVPAGVAKDIFIMARLYDGANRPVNQNGVAPTPHLTGSVAATWDYWGGMQWSGHTAAGTDNTHIVFDSTASSVDSVYNGYVVRLMPPTYHAVVHRIVAYNGATRTATTAPWPDCGISPGTWNDPDFGLPPAGWDVMVNAVPDEDTLFAPGSQYFVIHVPSMTVGQSVQVTCEDWSHVNNAQQFRHRLSNTLTITAV